MNKSGLKKFATNIRIELLSLVKTKVDYFLKLDISNLPIEFKSYESSIKEIKNRCTSDEKVDKSRYEDFIEEVSYTWFNRLVALRFMDVNDITETKVISPLDGHTIPAIFTEAKAGNISDDLNIDKTQFFNILDKKVESKDSDNECYKMLFISTCNYYSSIMPFMFESIADYTELLLPDDLLSANSIRTKVIEEMEKEDCSDVEVIGWLYQFYISEKKDEVIQAKKKYKTSEIPFASQLFTPDWLVQYITDNTLGQLWMENNPNSSLVEHMKYYVKRDTQSNSNIKVEDIKVIDPCCGSAHILVYAFDLLVKMYEEEGYSKSSIPKLILEKNLYGCDIDKRAAMLANFALTMKATLYHKRFLKNPVKPNVIVLEEYGDERFKGIKNYGSLVRISEDNSYNDGIFSQTTDEYNLQVKILTDKFDCVITNPPYINSSYMNDELKQFVSNNYPNTKSDLFAAFMERVPEITKDNGYMGFVTPFVWMFIKSYEWLREFILNNTTITNLVQLEYNAFGPAVVPVCSFTIKNSVEDGVGKYIRLSDFKGIDNQPLKTLEAINYTTNYLYISDQKNFARIPDSPIVYWVSEKLLKSFEHSLIKSLGEPKKGMVTANNDKYLRMWHEIAKDTLGLNIKSLEQAKNSSYTWFPYNKGGEYRKWYGNIEYCINWRNGGEDLYNEKKFSDRNVNYSFTQGLTWTVVTNSNFSIRLQKQGFMLDAAAGVIYNIDKSLVNYLLAALNTKILNECIKFIAPTLNNQSGDIAKLPIVQGSDTDKKTIDHFVEDILLINEEEWDSRETSWDFTKNELLKYKSDSKIETAYNNYCSYWREKFYKLHANEEELNRLFIDIYELGDELTPDVALKDITILKSESIINDNNELEFKADEIMKQFISYAVGVMFGRYSLDSDGLVVANLNQDYPKDSTFEIDDDNVIPVLEDDYFSDDIASRVINFVKTTFGAQNLSENINFIEKCLGKTIRAYMVKDFYEDHIKRYKKRPIYWMVSSPKKGFMSLSYMHRYTNDLFARVQNNYLREYITKLEGTKDILKQIIVDESASSKDKKDADKKIKDIENKLKELISFDRDVLTSFAQNRVDIDLDDGVKVNYNKFKDVLYVIKGLDKE
ncbi:BREX-1 system adenine-specific DNA-methyltransferase PglX [Aliarcobacter cryaerophilus]|uniref:BREX-1 system adenine-specific DNA-methyltransferase PglX n=1 Tax=Aliarcobacter cryaerophilus TaxID=28198 RepID=UPI003DA32A5F